MKRLASLLMLCAAGLMADEKPVEKSPEQKRIEQLQAENKRLKNQLQLLIQAYQGADKQAEGCRESLKSVIPFMQMQQPTPEPKQ